MLRLTLAQMRRSLGRLTSAGIAIAISTAFVTATLLAGNVITRTTYDAIAASYADADLVVVGTGITADVLETVRSTPGVDAVTARPAVGVQLSAGPHQVYATVTETAARPRLEAQTLVSGAFPTAEGEVTLPRPMAELLHVALGGTVDASHSVLSRAGSSDTAPATGATPAIRDTWKEQHDQLTVVGLVEDRAGAFSQSGGAIVLAPHQAEAIARDQTAPDPVQYENLTVLAQDRAQITAVKGALSGVVPTGVTVRTKDDEARAGVAQATGDTESVTTVVLGFAAIALIVAALVISNTFQVIVAQRTRTLALLRCVGASKGQLRRSVLFEATVLGVAASVVGLATGTAAVQITLQVLRQMDIGVTLPTSATLSPAVVIVPLLVGTAVTLVASLSPARAATRVAPLAALRPADVPSVGRAGRKRLVFASVLVAVGLALLIGAVVGATRLGPMAALGIGVLGGTSSFLGMLIGAVLWVPQVVGAAGRVLARSGTSAKLAAANTVRNPRRTAATSTALLIGVTLVAMMSTGAASARASLGSTLDSHYPVDVSISSLTTGDGTMAALPPDVVSAVSQVPGVHSVVPLTRSTVVVTGRPTATDGTPQGQTATVLGISAQDAAQAVRSTPATTGLDARTIIVPRDAAQGMGIADGDVVTIAVSDTELDGRPLTGAPTMTLTAAVTTLPGWDLLITPDTLAAVAADAPVSMLWVRLTDVTDAGTTVPAIQDALSQSSVQITGGGVERASFQRVIDTLLALVVGLLAVAVVIALVGVANTLSLSVIERQRESATLRAIGLRRSQLRWMLAIEGMLIAGVGAILGVALGTLYGWAGAATMLAPVGQVHLAVPWRDLGLVLLVAVVAGLLASVLPGRAASRTSPVAALAVD